MSNYAGKLNKLSDGTYCFRCPGCKDFHRILPDRWSWNQSWDKPTFSPSLLITTGHYCSGWKPGDNCWCTYNKEHPDSPAPFSCAVCHSFVVEGRIQFLSDCTHHLAGQTVDIPDWRS